MLGIYAQNGQIDLGLAQPLIDDFVQGGNRFSSFLHFSGCILVSVNELQEENNFIDCEHGKIIYAGNVFEENNSSSEQAIKNCFENRLRIDQLVGAFTAACYSPESHNLQLINDKFGMRPLFWANLKGHLFFCSEFEPLNLLPKLSLNQDAVAEYFSLGTTLGEKTFRNEITNLVPASHLEINRESISIKRYWQPSIKIDAQKSLRDHAISIAATLKTVVQTSLAQITNPLCLLSAGADSRLILTCMEPNLRKEMPFLTSNLSILKPEEDKDVIGANALAAHLGLSKHEVTKMAFAELDFGKDYFDRNRHLRAKKVIGGWHGGEFLGGFCNSAAPIHANIKRSDVEARMRTTLSRRFIRQLRQHPFDALQAELAKLPAENRDFHFQIQQLSRGFFTNIYFGSRGHWLQPWQTIIHGYSPFWDSRFLNALLQIPFELIANYKLYNEIFASSLQELTQIPSNSPLTNRADSSIPKMKEGIEPKFALQPKYQKALEEYLTDKQTWKRRQYPRWGFKKQLKDGNSRLTMQFIDFEAWMRRFG